MTSSSYPPHSSASSILLNTGQVFDCAKDKSSIVNGKQLLANKPLNVGASAGSQHSLASAAPNNNNISSTGSHATKNKKSRDKHKPNIYASDDLGRRKGQGCCRCMGPKSTAFWIGLLTNLGICTLLFAYTLLGRYLSKYCCQLMHASSNPRLIGTGNHPFDPLSLLLR